jgi:hypothetical protein
MLAEWGCDYMQGEWIGQASLEVPHMSALPLPPRAASA